MLRSVVTFAFIWNKICSVIGPCCVIGAASIMGMAKGAGMIRPDMATMLAFIATDAAFEQGPLQSCLEQAVGRSFNRITVDGDTSTNDACMLIATGRSSLPAIGADGTIYLGTDSGELQAYTPDGTLLWSYPAIGHVGEPVVDAEGTIYVAAGLENYVYAINPDGSEKWVSEFQYDYDWIGHCVIANDGTLYVLRGYEALYAFGPED